MTDSPEKIEESPRLLSLDAFRGITILGMTLVNHPGSWGEGTRYAPLDHAEWHGWTPTDFVFPFFIFIVGTALAYSLRKYRDGGKTPAAVYWRIIRRTAVLFLLGVGLELFGRIANVWLGISESVDFSTLRILGVLQRIALVYFAASLIALHIPVRGQLALALAILLGYWGALAWLPSENYEKNLSADYNVGRVIDVAVLGKPHMYTQSTDQPTEPEGLLSTLPSIVTVLLGYWAGLIIQRRGPTFSAVLALAACGLALAALALLWDGAFPINKKLWTSSFVLFTGGLANIGLALCLALFDVLGFRRLARPLEIVGVNAIFVYVGSHILDHFLDATHVGTQTTRDWIFHHAFADHLADPRLASLGFALMIVAVWWLAALVMARRGWSLRV